MIKNGRYTKSCTLSKSEEFFEENNKYLNHIRKEFSTTSAPNKITDLEFEDIKVFARVVLHAADAINIAFTPSNDLIATKIPAKYQFKNLTHDPKRRNKSILAYLRMEYGLKQDHAELVLNELLAH